MLNSLRHKDLVHKSFNGTSFSTNSIEINDFLRDDNEVPLSAAYEHYAGYSKPFQHLFLELSTFSISRTTLLVEYWNGTAWTPVPNLFDDTRGASRSGLIRWEFEVSDEIRDSWSPNVVDSENAYWIKITASEAKRAEQSGAVLTGSTDTVINLSNEDIINFPVGSVILVEGETEYSTVSDFDATTGAANITLDSPLSSIPLEGTEIREPLQVKGLNIVFCDDADLESENPRIKDFLLKGQLSFINYRVSATKQIVQTLRNGGWYKMFNADSRLSPNLSNKALCRLRAMGKWDILDIDEVREAAKFLTLSKIFFELSENVDDKFKEKSRAYEGKFSEAFKLFFLTLDLDDDGEIDRKEERNDTSLEIVRL